MGSEVTDISSHQLLSPFYFCSLVMRDSVYPSLQEFQMCCVFGDQTKRNREKRDGWRVSILLQFFLSCPCMKSCFHILWLQSCKTSVSHQVYYTTLNLFSGTSMSLCFTSRNSARNHFKSQSCKSVCDIINGLCANVKKMWVYDGWLTKVMRCYLYFHSCMKSASWEENDRFVVFFASGLREMYKRQHSAPRGHEMIGESEIFSQTFLWLCLSKNAFPIKGKLCHLL